MNPLIIRTDYSSEIGVGHVMRCLALAQEWKSQNNGEVLFISNSSNPTIEARIQREGCHFVPLEKINDETDEIQCICSIIKTYKNQHFACRKDHWIVIDGYHFTSSYLSVLKSSGHRILVIDDIAHLDYYYTDIILNQNIKASNLKYRHDFGTQLLLGTNYLLMRNEFLKSVKRSMRIDREVKNILVTMGGADSSNMTSKVCKAFKMMDKANYWIKILVGPLNPNMRSIKSEISKLNLKIELVSTIDDMPNLINWADISISAGGSTCWEMAFLGLPALVVVVADNQKNTMSQLEQIGTIKNLGWHAEVSSIQIVHELSSLIQNHQLRKRMSVIGRSLIDGRGRKRVVDSMLRKER